MELANRQEVNAIVFDGYQTIHDSKAEDDICPKLRTQRILSSR